MGAQRRVQRSRGRQDAALHQQHARVNGSAQAHQQRLRPEQERHVTGAAYPSGPSSGL